MSSKMMAGKSVVNFKEMSKKREANPKQRMQMWTVYHKVV
jgi:hypothetical protein